MPTLTVASMNIEWMNKWFVPDAQGPAFRDSYAEDGQTVDVPITAGRVAATIRAIDPDVLAVQEGASHPGEMRLFVDEFLTDAGVPRYQSILGDGGQQKLALLFKPDIVDAATAVPPAPAPAPIALLTELFSADVDCTAELAPYKFTRRPLAVDLQVDGQPLQIIVMHTKSSFVNQGRRLWQNPATRQQYVVEALRNRRRNAAEGMRLRKYLDTLLEADPAAPILVVGDLNDGPGLDYFEENYLARSVVDAVIGTAFVPEWQFEHALYDVDPALRYTAVFDDFITEEVNKPLLLDHVLVSPALPRVPGSGTIHHAEYDAQVVNNGRRRQDRPSDHRPVSVQLLF